MRKSILLKKFINKLDIHSNIKIGIMEGISSIMGISDNTNGIVNLFESVGLQSDVDLINEATSLLESFSEEEIKRISIDAITDANLIAEYYDNNDNAAAMDQLEQIRYKGNNYEGERLDYYFSAFKKRLKNITDDDVYEKIENDYIKLNQPQKINYSKKKELNKKAEESYKKKNIEPEFSYDNQYKTGNMYTGQKKFSLAATAYKNAASVAENKKDLVMALAGQAQSLINAGSQREALVPLKELLKQAPNNSWAKRKMYRVKRNLKLETSEEYFKRKK